MSAFRLVRVRGRQPEESWSLPPDRQTLIGRYDPHQPAPDIDLGPDLKVSRRHAVICNENGEWRIKDESTNGMRVHGAKIRGGGPLRLEPGTEIQLGDTVLMFVSPQWHRLTGRNGSLIVELEVTPTINFSSVHCGMPVVSRLLVRNWGADRSAPGTLAIMLEGCGHNQQIAIPPLPPGHSMDLPQPEFHWDSQALEARTEQVKRALSVTLDGRVLTDERIECWILAHNEWSQAPEHRLATAAFVLPNHPLVTQVASDAGQHLTNDGKPAEVLAAVYEYLFTHWHLRYLYEPPSWEFASQKIRLPHQVLLDTAHKKGQGTCIDLALLIAGCLECLGLQPLIALLDMGEWRHALVGCWLQARSRLEAVLGDKQQVLKGALWVEPLGCTQAPAQCMDFHHASATAEKLLVEKPFLCAVDIAVARTIEGIRPLPFAGEPGWSEAVAAGVARARDYAQVAGQRVGTVPLLLSLLVVRGGVTREVCERGGIEPEQAVHRLEEGLRQLQGSGETDTQTTRHYEQVLTAARALARWEGASLVLEHHVLTALLETPSQALDSALAALRTNRHAWLDILRERQSDPSRSSVFLDFPSQF